MIQVFSTAEYDAWFKEQSHKGQAQVMARLYRITEYGHFGDKKVITSRFSELRWKNGLRVYFAFIKHWDGRSILLLIGGNKNSQKKDIQKASHLLDKISKDHDEKNY